MNRTFRNQLYMDEKFQKRSMYRLQKTTAEAWVWGLRSARARIQEPSGALAPGRCARTKVHFLRAQRDAFGALSLDDLVQEDDEGQDVGRIAEEPEDIHPAQELRQTRAA